MSNYNLTGNSTINYDGSNFIIDDINYSGPLTITTNESFQITVLLNFSDEISNLNDYIIIDMSNIIIDGQKKQIDININNYTGLFSYSNNSLTNIIIQNITIKAINNINIADSCGWICDDSEFNNTTINNCVAYGNVESSNGGFFGINCTNCIANNCFFSGKISNYSGGIFGKYSTTCIANNCYTSGNINGSSGGIFGSDSTSCIANNCFSIGNIKGGSGGIFGYNSNICITNNCYSIGKIGATDEYNNGGIFAFSNACTANFCFSIGYIWRSKWWEWRYFCSGYIFTKC